MEPIKPKDIPEEEEASGNSRMGEVYEEYMTIEHWGQSDTPGLGEVHIRQEDILSEYELGEGEPIEQEEEGYTGNAGMTIEYWYHYGAVILWPSNKHLEILSGKPVFVRLQWIGYYLRHWDDTQVPAQEYTRQLINSLKATEEADEKKKKDWKKLYGAWAEEKESAEELISLIRTSRFVNRQNRISGLSYLLDTNIVIFFFKGRFDIDEKLDAIGVEKYLKTGSGRAVMKKRFV